MSRILTSLWDQALETKKALNLIRLIEENYLQCLPLRERVFFLDKILIKYFNGFDARCLPVKHFISNGIYSRELQVPAGFGLVGLIAKYSNIFTVLKGDVLLYDGTDAQRITGPYTFISKEGINRFGYMFTDATFMSSYKMPDPKETDVEKIKWQLLTDTYEKFDRFKLEMLI